jgi:hypothetical protein
MVMNRRAHPSLNNSKIEESINTGGGILTSDVASSAETAGKLSTRILKRRISAGLCLLAIPSFVYLISGQPTNNILSYTSDDKVEERVPEYCQYFDGVLWISQGDRNGAAGTIFFLFVLNQLLYAEKHNLQPWIHLNGISRHVYDPQVDGDGRKQEFPMIKGMQVSWETYQDPLSNKNYSFPAKPIWKESPQQTSVSVEGSGVWGNYFESTVPLLLGNENKHKFDVNINRPCPNKPLVHLSSNEELVNGVHLNCPYCVRAWKYGGMPPSLKRPSDSYHDWWEPMRRTGRRMVQKYYHPKPQLVHLAKKSNPLLLPDPRSISGENDRPISKPLSCLAMHIRHSDKANKREKIPLKAFLPYCQTYVEMGGPVIYLATDSSRVIEKIQTEWPSSIVPKIRYQSNAFRSPNETSVFDAILEQPTTSFLKNDSREASIDSTTSDFIRGHHHRTNVEVLVDILAMAKCNWFLHGLSAVSEATFYFNGNLHEQSVNLEFYQFYQRRSSQQQGGDAPLSVEKFRQLLRDKGV